jgi:hypothetical protein
MGKRFKLTRGYNEEDELYSHYVSNEDAEKIFLDDHKFIEFKSHYDYSTYGYIKIVIEHNEDPDILYDGVLMFTNMALKINANYHADLRNWWLGKEKEEQINVYDKQ